MPEKLSYDEALDHLRSDVAMLERSGTPHDGIYWLCSSKIDSWVLYGHIDEMTADAVAVDFKKEYHES